MRAQEVARHHLLTDGNLVACCSVVGCRQLGLGMGLTPEQLVLYGLPIRPIFSKKLPSKGALRKKLVSLSVCCCWGSALPFCPWIPLGRLCLGLFSMQEETWGWEHRLLLLMLLC